MFICTLLAPDWYGSQMAEDKSFQLYLLCTRTQSLNLHLLEVLAYAELISPHSWSGAALSC